MDPVSDMFIRIKNAQRAGHQRVQIPYSRLKHEIAKVLERHGFLDQIERRGKRVRKVLEVGLKGGKDAPAVHDIAFISKPSRRLYSSWRELRAHGRRGIVVVSTPKGVMSGAEARAAKVGGELIAEVW
ncbi:MAG: 30S ribosomal protein S8 [Candidatus Sungbacteria bacterium]|uniref:Small ribosomal subunit protein uS8 n=1 Tax=Candidatus Sungiibacteriota bacterium TaxID=2750080 RepID=A0A932R274_9BACT|nr:30S ribosomal protein S8 [Candidatus Sungbacteria bacterium]